MDLNEYWQENKRFVTSVALGGLVFLVTYWILGRSFERDLRSTRASVVRLRRDLGSQMFTAADRQEAREENDALRAAVDGLERAAVFDVRSDFRLERNRGSGTNQYQRALTRVRDDLLPRANRANLRIDAGLGMPKLSPTRDAEIERYLEALDLIESTVRDAIDAHIDRVDKIQIRLDPGLDSRAGLGRVEHTRVQFTLVGSSLALTRLLVATQRPHDGRVLHVADAELVPSRSKEDELRLDLTLVIARLHEPEGEEG